MASLAERVRTGMQQAKAPGKHTGRPALPLAKRTAIEARLAEVPCPSDRAIARGVGVAPGTVAKVRRAMRQGNE
jgi:DNA invertase Pin-like site-specific DNA recombinase